MKLIGFRPQEYRQREEELMVAAKSGSYRLGVDALLRRNELPATLRDAEGRTILHHAASARDTKGAPLWTADNIRSFLANHTCFVNAVDYQGTSESVSQNLKEKSKRLRNNFYFQ